LKAWNSHSPLRFSGGYSAPQPADKSVTRGENLDRCLACHKGQAKQEFVFTLDRMESAK
jgi:hypothetical protein